jgi:hypothetical protein
VSPPFVGVAVKVTDVPSQTGFAEGATATLTGRIGSTVSVTVLEDAGLPVAHGTAFDVRMTYTWSPVIGV